MQRLFLVTFAIAAAALPASVAAQEQQRNSNLEAVTRCRGIAESSARLACYDAAAGALEEAVRQNELVVMNREQVRSTRRSLFGFSVPRVPLFGGGDDDQEEITATIASVRAAGYGKWQFSLEDGAVWQTIDADHNQPRRGDTVRIRRGVLGNYFIRFNGGRASRGRRTG